MNVLLTLCLLFLKMKNNLLNLNKSIITTITLFLLGISFPFYIGASFLVVGLILNWFGFFVALLFALVRVLLFSDGSRFYLFEGLIIVSMSIVIFIIKKYTRKNNNSYEFI